MANDSHGGASDNHGGAMVVAEATKSGKSIAVGQFCTYIIGRPSASWFVSSDPTSRNIFGVNGGWSSVC